MRVQKPNKFPSLKVVSCTVMLAFGPPHSVAAGHGDGYAAFEAGDYRNAARLLKTPAEQGDAKARHLLATLYRLGRGVEHDEREAFYWCRLAAMEGHVDAQYQLGMMYLKGEGVEESDANAIEWLDQASRAGHEQAASVLEYVINNDFIFGC